MSSLKRNSNDYRVHQVMDAKITSLDANAFHMFKSSMQTNNAILAALRNYIDCSANKTFTAST